MKKCISFFVLFLLSVTICLAGLPKGTSFKSSASPAFIENKGQIIDQNSRPNTRVLYLLNTPGFNVQLRKAGFSYDLYTASGLKPQASSLRLQATGLKQQATDQGLKPEACCLKYHRIDFDLLNANLNPVIETSEPSSDYVNYFTTGTSAKGATNVRSYQKIMYKDIYPGIDLEFIPDPSSGFKYNFIVHPGGDLNSIRMNILGPVVDITSSGSLLLKTSIGTIEEKIPSCSFKNESQSILASVSFIRIEDNIYGFSLITPLINHSSLIIDPMPWRIWGTYYGGSGSDGGSIAGVRNGFIYLIGSTRSYNNIATSGAYQDTMKGNYDEFIAKFNSDGNRIWGTYYGGDSVELPGFSALDRSGNIIVCGRSNSTNYISTPGAYQENKASIFDAYLAKFDTNGMLIWGTYYGGTGGDMGLRCRFSEHGYLFLSGTTWSPNNIASTGAFKTYLSGLCDAFLVEFTPAGQRIWGTYYGGMGTEDGSQCAILSPGSVLLGGRTGSTDGIATAGSHQPVFGGYEDAYLVKFDFSGNRQWGTYYGGISQELADDCAIDDSLNIFLSGATESPDNISTPGSYKPVYTGLMDAFLVKFDSNGQRIWATYYGSTGVDYGGETVIEGDHIYFSGQTSSVDSIASIGSFQDSLGGWSDGFLVKFGDCLKPDSAHQIYGPVNLCTDPSGVIYSINAIAHATSYLWKLPPGAAITSGQNTTSITVVFSQPVFSGFISVCGVNSCWHGDSSYIPITVNQSPVPVINGSDTSCPDQTFIYSTSSGKSLYQWTKSAGGTIVSGGTGTDNQVGIQWTNPGLQWVRVNYTDTNGCAGSVPSQFNVYVGTGDSVKISIIASANTICSGTPVTFTANPTNPGSSPIYHWKVNGINVGTNSTTFAYTPMNGDIVTCVLTSSNTFCTSNNPALSNQVIMVILVIKDVSVSISASANPVCAGTSVTFTATPTNGGANPTYQWKVNGINVGFNSPSYTYVPLNSDLVSCELTSNIQCPVVNPVTSNTLQITINNNLPAAVSISPSVNPFCPGNSVTFTATPVNGGTNPIYQWKVNGINRGTNSPTYSYNPVSGDLVSCILTSNLSCVTGNPSTSNTITMSGTLASVVTFTRCFDSITTTIAQPFKLKGGIPLGGTYSGAGVTNGIFYPSIAGIGIHQITYTYTNAALCSVSAQSSVRSLQPAVFSCGNSLDDIRDNKTYTTIQIGSQCWMASNLNYGTMIPANSSQRDNCIPEKYCPNDLTANCGLLTADYQWDELMNYDENISKQGLCPPGWHIPSEADWNTLFAEFTNNSFAGSPLKYSGFSGFNALLNGAWHLNEKWDYAGFATFFWSSTSHSTLKSWAHGMNEPDPSVSAYPAFRTNAFSVRCLKGN